MTEHRPNSINFGENLQNMNYDNYEIVIDQHHRDNKEIMLIDAVKICPYIYDHKNPNFKNERMKEAAWQEIARTVDRPVEECIRCWRNLRRKFCAEKREQDSWHADSDIALIPRFSFYQNMLFLKEHVRTRFSTNPMPKIKRQKLGKEIARRSNTIISSSPKIPLMQGKTKVINSKKRALSAPIESSSCSRIAAITTHFMTKTMNIVPPKVPSEIQKNNESSRSTMSLSSCRCLTSPSVPSNHRPKTPSQKRLNRKDRRAALLQRTLVLLCDLTSFLFEKPRAFEVKNGNENYFGTLVATELQRISPEERRMKKLAILQILYQSYTP